MDIFCRKNSIMYFKKTLESYTSKFQLRFSEWKDYILFYFLQILFAFSEFFALIYITFCAKNTF